jgi:hypothetical protein
MPSIIKYTNTIPDPTVRKAVKELFDAVYADLTELKTSSVINAPTLSTGSTAANVATTAFQYRIAGVTYAKAAVAAGTALGITDTINTGAATGLFFGGFACQINASGTISFKSASTDQVYTSEAAAYAAALGITPTAANVIIGHFVVGAKADTDWVAGTDDLTAASDCASATFYSVNASQHLEA